MDEPRYDPTTGLNVPQVAIFMVFVVMFLDTIGATISTPALPYYAQKFGCNNTQIGYLFGAWSFTSFACAPVLGRLADAIGRRTVLLISLIGAGTAAMLQGFAVNYVMLLLARAFSGVWSAVGSTAQVYIADSCSPAMLPIYMARLSAVPGLAMIFGPGLGGGLSKFGLNVPIIVDGAVSLFSSILVFLYLPESKEWLALKRKKRDIKAGATSEKSPLQQHDQAVDSGDNASGADEAGLPDPVTTTQDKSHVRTLTFLSLSQFFNGITFSSIVSMLAVSLAAKLDFDALEVGYTFVALAVVMVCTAIWVTPFIQAKVGVAEAAVWGTVVTAVALIGFAESNTVVTALISLACSRSAQSLRGASFGTIVTTATSIQNRGATLARVQLFLNGGRLVGPLIAGHLADSDPKRSVWYVAAAASLVSAAFLSVTLHTTREKRGTGRGRRNLMVRGYTDLRGMSSCPLSYCTTPSHIYYNPGPSAPETLEDDCPSEEDVNELGKWMADLLTRRHYHWCSRKEATRKMIEALLPELQTNCSEHVQDLESLMKFASLMQTEMARHAHVAHAY